MAVNHCIKLHFHSQIQTKNHQKVATLIWCIIEISFIGNLKQILSLIFVSGVRMYTTLCVTNFNNISYQCSNTAIDLNGKILLSWSARAEDGIKWVHIVYVNQFDQKFIYIRFVFVPSRRVQLKHVHSELFLWCNETIPPNTECHSLNQ